MRLKYPDLSVWLAFGQHSEVKSDYLNCFICCTHKICTWVPNKKLFSISKLPPSHSHPSGQLSILASLHKGKPFGYISSHIISIYVESVPLYKAPENHYKTKKKAFFPFSEKGAESKPLYKVLWRWYSYDRVRQPQTLKQGQRTSLQNSQVDSFPSAVKVGRKTKHNWHSTVCLCTQPTSP